MNTSTQARLQALFEEAQDQTELRIESAAGVLRLDLDPADLRLWQETLQNYSTPTNLLLACETQEGKLQNTKLTWVVGAAIRPTLVSSSEEAVDLLAALGIARTLASMVPAHCPGLGGDLAWAFYIERHGLLSASPILSPTEVESLRAQHVSPE